jgi:anti-sigma factor RsiW
MDENLECPDHEILLDFVARRLDEAADRRVAAHLDACERCSEAVERIIANLAKENKDELEGGSSSTKAFPSHLAAQLKTDASEPLEDESFDTNLLAPSSKKGTIGRLGKYDVCGGPWRSRCLIANWPPAQWPDAGSFARLGPQRASST